MIHEIKQLIIGSDDDTITAENINGLTDVPTDAYNTILSNIQNFELIENDDEIHTSTLEKFVDNENYGAAYALGYKSYMSMSAKNESNEIVYLVRVL